MSKNLDRLKFTIKKKNLDTTKKANICCIVKNEEPYLNEWLLYHNKLGFSHFYIYDNSDENTLSTFKFDIKLKNKISVFHYPGKQMQINAYNDYIKNHAYCSTWSAFIDVDEFIVLKEWVPIVKFLERYCPNGSISLNWYIYGDNYQLKYINEPVIKRFTNRQNSYNHHVKTIVFNDDLLACMSPHYIELKSNKQVNCLDMNEDDKKYNELKIIHGPFNKNNDSSNVAHINHYFGKTIEEYILKKNRGRVSSLKVRNFHDFHLMNHNEIEDTSALDFYLNPELDFSVKIK